MEDPKDIAGIFLQWQPVLVLCGLLGGALYGIPTLVILKKINFGAMKTPYKVLKVVVPENLDYEREFEDIFNKYTVSHELQKVKTTDLGTLYELVYLVNLYYGTKEKEFIDALRCRNGNLNIVLGMKAESEYNSL